VNYTKTVAECEAGETNKRDSMVSVNVQRLHKSVGVPPGKRLFNINEAALYLGRSVCALREMVWAGKIPIVRDGKRILLDIHDMDAWIERSKTQITC